LEDKKEKIKHIEQQKVSVIRTQAPGSAPERSTIKFYTTVLRFLTQPLLSCCKSYLFLSLITNKLAFSKKSLIILQDTNSYQFFLSWHLLARHCSNELVFYVNFIRGWYHHIFSKVRIPYQHPASRNRAWSPTAVAITALKIRKNRI